MCSATDLARPPSAATSTEAVGRRQGCRELGDLAAVGARRGDPPARPGRLLGAGIALRVAPRLAVDRGLDVLDVGEREVGPIEALEPSDDDVQVRVAALDLAADEDERSRAGDEPIASEDRRRDDQVD